MESRSRAARMFRSPKASFPRSLTAERARAFAGRFESASQWTKARRPSLVIEEFRKLANSVRKFWVSFSRSTRAASSEVLPHLSLIAEPRPQLVDART